MMIMMTTVPEGKQQDGRYCRYFRLGATEVDLHNRMRLQALLGFFQETAGDQCEEFGSGWKALWNGHGLCYVVVRMEIRMERYPGTGERIRVDTWPENKLRMIFARYGEIFDESGARLGSIVSQWALLDVNKRHFVRPTPEIVAMPDTSTLSAPFELSGEVRATKVNADEAAGARPEVRAFSVSRRPVYSDFDYNGHMNNSRYAEWVNDALWMAFTAEERAAEPFVKRLNIKFRAEIPAGMADSEITVSGETAHFEADADYEMIG